MTDRAGGRLLSVSDPLAAAPARVLVAGVSGVGKTTFAKRVSQIADVPHTEIDGLFHGPNWTPRESFLDDVRELAHSDAWVTEWQYAAARPILAERANLLVWLDLPFFTVTLPRVISRTVARRIRREELWNGNREAPLHTFFTNREHIVRWSWSTRKKYGESVPALAAQHSQLTVVRLRTTREVERWLADTLPGAVRGG